ncbi:hypothetical protein HY604_04245 [Candidatus Peregrinibacteria bacterium]|nr:hypothetical protein [Candidatus Peregrinibacteria bacterium]
MEKTIKSLVLLMIITGTIFTLTACSSGIGSQHPKKEEEDVAVELNENAEVSEDVASEEADIEAGGDSERDGEENPEGESVEIEGFAGESTAEVDGGDAQ